MEKTLLKKFMSELILHNQFIDDVFFSQLIDSREVEFYKTMKGTERKFSYVSYRYSDYPDENVLEKYEPRWKTRLKALKKWQRKNQKTSMQKRAVIWAPSITTRSRGLSKTKRMSGKFLALKKMS